MIQEWLNSLRIFISEYPWLAPIFALFLPFLEAVVPSLPLTAIVAFSISVCSAAFGPIWGTIVAVLLSIIGSFSGMILIHQFIVGKLRPKFEKKVADSPFGQKFLDAVNNKTTFGVFLLMANPFFPSSIINYALSLTRVNRTKYWMLTIASRIVIIFFLAFLGSLMNVQEHPLNILWYLLVYTWLFGIWYLIYRKKSKADSTK